MADDSHGADKHRDALPRYADKSAEADDAVTISVSTTPGEWLVNTNESVVLPMSMAEVVDALRAGKLSERSLVWRQGMQEWATIDNVPQLKLAARLPLTRVLSAVTTAAAEQLAAPPMPASSPRKPPPKPARATPVPQGLSRRSTLPFGIPPQKPPSRPSNPAQLKLTPLPRAASVPQLSSDEPPALAVYDRPAATISFELDKADSVRAPVPAPPETLAPTTSDARPERRASYAPPAEPDLAVVAESQLQALRRSAKRLVVASSLASAAAASLLTFWLSQRSAPAPAATLRPPPAAAVAPPVPAITPTEAAPGGPAEPSPSALPESPPAAAAASAKPPSKKARAARWSPRPAEAASAAKAPAVGRNPSSEPNPYDVKLEDDEPSESKKSAAPRSPAIESTAHEADASTATGSSSPGF